MITSHPRIWIWRTTGGTPALRHVRPTANAPSLQKPINAGAIVLGKFNMHELVISGRALPTATGLTSGARSAPFSSMRTAPRISMRSACTARSRRRNASYFADDALDAALFPTTILPAASIDGGAPVDAFSTFIGNTDPGSNAGIRGCRYSQV